MARGSQHRMILLEDFWGAHDPLTNTAVPREVRNLRLVGQGIAETDSGAPALDTDAISGVVQLTTTDENQHCCALETSRMFDVGLMGSLTAEVRIRQASLANKNVFMGFVDIAVAGYVPSIEVDIIDVTAATTFDLGGSANTATTFAGFVMNSELTSATEWHAPYFGGGTAGPTASNSVDLNVNASAGDWVILRLKILPNGNTIWMVDDAKLQTVPAAISTSTDLKFMLGVESKTTAVATLDVDYVKIECYRDWTV